MSNRYDNTSPLAREQRPYGAAVTHVMETEAHPLQATFQYQVGQYVYVHTHAYDTNPLDAQECCVMDVTNAPLEIAVRPCNSDEVFTVAQDKLSAPIFV